MYLHRVKRRKQNCSEVLWTAQAGITITTKKKKKVYGHKTIIQVKSRQKMPTAKILLHRNERMPKSLGYNCLSSALVIKDISCKLFEVFMQPCHIISLLT